MKIRQADTLAEEIVQMGRLDHGVSMRGNFPIALVVRNDDNDIGRSIQGTGTATQPEHKNQPDNRWGDESHAA
jgi:hypothetical protein